MLQHKTCPMTLYILQALLTASALTNTCSNRTRELETVNNSMFPMDEAFFTFYPISLFRRGREREVGGVIWGENKNMGIYS